MFGIFSHQSPPLFVRALYWGKSGDWKFIIKCHTVSVVAICCSAFCHVVALVPVNIVGLKFNASIDIYVVAFTTQVMAFINNKSCYKQARHSCQKYYGVFS